LELSQLSEALLELRCVALDEVNSFLLLGKPLFAALLLIIKSC
jgi:hypothetical protein